MQQRHLAERFEAQQVGLRQRLPHGRARDAAGAAGQQLVAIAACMKSRREITLFAYRRRFDGQPFADTGEVEFERNVLRRPIR